jgi:hypothetical protein
MPGSSTRRAPWLLAVAAAGIAGCGASTGHTTTTWNTSDLGHTIARSAAQTPSPSPAATLGAASAPAGSEIQAPEDIHPSPPPSPTAPGFRAIVVIATRFGRAYLSYEIGEHPPSVEQAIRATCTRFFAGLLLAQPARIPNASRNSPAYQPATLGRVTYTGPASFGPGPPVQIVIATYATIGHPEVGGQLTMHLTPSRGGWRVAGLGSASCDGC